MKIKTKRFGVQDANPEKTIFFPNGIVGFEEFKEYQIFHENHEDHVVYYLQSMDNPSLTLNTIIPEQFGMKYNFELSHEYLNILEAKNGKNLITLCVISKTDDESAINAHPECPILIDSVTKKGLQMKSGEIRFDIDKKINRAA